MVSDEDVKKSTIREFDSQGRLARAGFWWFGPRRRVYKALTAGFVVCALIGATAGVVALSCFIFGKSTAGLVSTALVALCIAGMVWIKRKGTLYATQRHAVVFCADGTILMEHPEQRVRHIRDFKSNLVPMRKGLKELTTIEMKPGRATRFGDVRHDTLLVCAYFSDGQEALLSYDVVSDEVARVVVVQLNRALREMREAIASRMVERPQEVN